MNEQTTAFSYLSADRVHHAGMLALLFKPETQILFAGAEGALLFYDQWLYLSSAANEAAAREMLGLIGQTGDVLLHQPYLSHALAAGGRAHDMDCHPCLYERETPIPLTLPEGVEVRLLTAADAPFVQAHYRAGSFEMPYITGRIGAGMLGLYEKGALAGFIGTHDEDEMGMLEILPAFRRKGYAYLLEASLINRLLAQGRSVHCEVETDNAASLALQKKLGMTVGTGTLSWFHEE